MDSLLENPPEANSDWSTLGRPTWPEYQAQVGEPVSRIANARAMPIHMTCL